VPSGHHCVAEAPTDAAAEMLSRSDEGDKKELKVEKLKINVSALPTNTKKFPSLYLKK